MPVLTGWPWGRLPTHSGLSCLAQDGEGSVGKNRRKTRSQCPGPTYFPATSSAPAAERCQGNRARKGLRPGQAARPSEVGTRTERPRGLPKATQQAASKAEAGTRSLLLNQEESSQQTHRLWLQPPAPLPSPAADEFGNQFEVNNCSSCYHWVTAKPQGPAVFSADYKGCHVLEKVGPPPLWGESQAGRPLMGQGCTHITQGAGGRGGLSPGLPPTNPAPACRPAGRSLALSLAGAAPSCSPVCLLPCRLGAPT